MLYCISRHSDHSPLTQPRLVPECQRVGGFVAPFVPVGDGDEGGEGLVAVLAREEALERGRVVAPVLHGEGN